MKAKPIAQISLRLLCAPWLPRTPRDSRAIPISAPAAVSASILSTNLQPLTFKPLGHESPVTNHRFLIANLELEFGVSSRKQSHSNHPNRERMAVFLGALSVPSSLQRQASGFQNLIDTPRLEINASATKQSLAHTSNRYKNASFSPAFRSAPVSVTPGLRGQTLTLPHPPSNLLSSCSVRGFAGAHSRDT